MIRFRLKELLAEKGEPGRPFTLYRLQKETSIGYENLRKIRDNRVTFIKTDTLDRLCYALNCTPSDLIEYRRGLYVMPTGENPSQPTKPAKPKKSVSLKKRKKPGR
jgi:putative transcriptional regulator